MTINKAWEATVSAEKVRELFDYDPLTGVLTRKVRTSNRIKAGDIAGYTHVRGYRRVRFCGRNVLVHRVIWIWMTGSWPKDQVDHEDGKTSRNVWSNLREATYEETPRNKSLHKNNKSGHPGVYRRTGKDRWIADITANGRRYYLGDFKTLAGAVAARAAAKARLHPFQPFDRA